MKDCPSILQVWSTHIANKMVPDSEVCWISASMLGDYLAACRVLIICQWKGLKGCLCVHLLLLDNSIFPLIFIVFFPLVLHKNPTNLPANKSLLLIYSLHMLCLNTADS